MIFFSGCPLRCFWCSNPEGQQFRRRLMFRSGRCRSCFACAQACPAKGVEIPDEGDRFPKFDRDRCDYCDEFRCVEVCAAGGLAVSGRRVAVSELMRILNRDRFYWGGKGGVTIGGGEPFHQAGPLLSLLTACRDASIHTAVETSGAVESTVFSAALSLLDWILFDVKHLDEEAHQRGTGTGNRRILENLRMVSRSGWPGRLLLRLTVVPGFNDGDDHLDRLAAFLLDLGIEDIQILPLHRLGLSKYTQLGLPEPSTRAPEETRMAAVAARLSAHGLTCYNGQEMTMTG